jgi:hypothetical protein
LPERSRPGHEAVCEGRCVAISDDRACCFAVIVRRSSVSGGLAVYSELGVLEAQAAPAQLALAVELVERVWAD